MHSLRILNVLALILGIVTMGEAQLPSSVRTGHSTGSLWFQGRSRHPLLTDPLIAKALPKEGKFLASHSYVVDTAIVANNTFQCDYPYVMRCLFAFDAQGNRVSELYQYREWDSETQQYVWPNDFRRTSTYDGQGNRLSYLEQWWSNEQWLNSARLTSTYDAQGNELTRLEESWSTDQWVNLSRASFTYDAVGNLLTQVGEYWSYDQLAWLKAFRATCTYDGHGNKLSRLEERWDSVWINSRRYAFTYDEQGNVLSDSTLSWSNGQWVSQGSHAYTYDAYGNPTTTYRRYEFPASHTYTYDTSGRMLVDSTNCTRARFSYDANGNVTIWSLDIYFVYQMGFLEEANLAFVDGGGYAHSYWGLTDTLHYRMITTGVVSERETAPQQYSLSQNYPNPFNPSTTINYTVGGARPQKSMVVVYDMLGRQVAELVKDVKAPGNYEVRFDASNLASGVYICQMTAGSFTQSKKMVVIK